MPKNAQTTIALISHTSKVMLKILQARLQQYANCQLPDVQVGFRKKPIIQSEVSQKEKHQYSILMHIYGIEKDGNDNPVCKTAKDTQSLFQWVNSLHEVAKVLEFQL